MSLCHFRKPHHKCFLAAFVSASSCWPGEYPWWSDGTAPCSSEEALYHRHGLCLLFLQQFQLATATFHPGSTYPFTGPRVTDLAVHWKSLWKGRGKNHRFCFKISSYKMSSNSLHSLLLHVFFLDSSIRKIIPILFLSKHKINLQIFSVRLY